MAAATAAPGSPLVLLNRHARGGRAAVMGTDLGGALSALSPPARLVVTASVAEAQAAIAALPPCGRVVVVGGDGTVHHLLPALLAGGHELALVPAGSGDDTARAFGLRGLGWHDALRLALSAPSRPIDLGEVRTACGVRPFVSSLCIGFDAAISARAQQGPRWLAGLPRYLMATLAEIVRLQAWQVQVTVDGRPFHDGPALFASVVNTPTYGGGMPIAPMARLDDARLDLIVAGRFGRVGALAMLPRLLGGTHLSHPRVAHATVVRMQVLCEEPLPMAADGEPMPAARAVDIEVLPRRLRVVSAAAPDRRDRP